MSISDTAKKEVDASAIPEHGGEQLPALGRVGGLVLEILRVIQLRLVSIFFGIGIAMNIPFAILLPLFVSYTVFTVLSYVLKKASKKLDSTTQIFRLISTVVAFITASCLVFFVFLIAGLGIMDYADLKDLLFWWVSFIALLLYFLFFIVEKIISSKFKSKGEIKNV